MSQTSALKRRERSASTEPEGVGIAGSAPTNRSRRASRDPADRSKERDPAVPLQAVRAERRVREVAAGRAPGGPRPRMTPNPTPPGHLRGDEQVPRSEVALLRNRRQVPYPPHEILAPPQKPGIDHRPERLPEPRERGLRDRRSPVIGRSRPGAFAKADEPLGHLAGPRREARRVEQGLQRAPHDGGLPPRLNPVDSRCARLGARRSCRRPMCPDPRLTPHPGGASDSGRLAATGSRFRPVKPATRPC
jgi:hypothetical protein